MAELPALSEARKLKLQLFHRLQRTNCNAWERYWGSFRLYLVAKLSHKEFHAVAEELLGPNKHLHNEFVVALLSTACHENENENKKKNNLQPHLAQQIEKHSEEGNLAAKRDDTSMILDDVSLLDFKCAKQERSESDFEQQRISYNKKLELCVPDRFREHVSIINADKAKMCYFMAAHNPCMKWCQLSTCFVQAWE
ncbi:Transcriptional coactivator Hfi1/Transcriptional adapter 1 [Plasmopara halstedii]|uniref:Transcriptional coactivator Hfi1/Transcriptional adapter 1 n=1 Tax=Plasmopara halstedii TaxID=4781 RepID=A0A0P1A5Q2_PLAHL|nr:Transcriptional coactivator Hfi1/Transcriptional adapter 1 [Plasmopara halstedii]CEG35895.1 Transcriptional coactivator Hfi1/Transcriptional adapter 1 [Plasmopara halstedii]|eukprot:XP_024572264.1 Transcriptional coactivator Hfi1/Transcriptional adapter 1 [Plasmopara halstedii]